MDITSYFKSVGFHWNNNTHLLLSNIRNYHTLRTMHVRGDQNPNQLVRRPMTAAQDSESYVVIRSHSH